MKFTARLADQQSRQLACYIHRNLQIYGRTTLAATAGRLRSREDCWGGVWYKVLSLFQDMLKIGVRKEDAEVVCRFGMWQKKNTPRGITIRFVSQTVWDSITYACRKLHVAGVVIVEDFLCSGQWRGVLHYARKHGLRTERQSWKMHEAELWQSSLFLIWPWQSWICILSALNSEEGFYIMQGSRY